MTPQIYVLHFAHPYRHARHYLGFTENLDRRLQQHRSGHGSPLVAAAINAGIDFELAAIWPGDRREERRLHRYKNSGARLCPICRVERQHRVSSAPVHPADELVLQVLADRDEPLTLPAITAMLHRCGHAPVGSLHSRLELLAIQGHLRKGVLLGEIAWVAQPRPAQTETAGTAPYGDLAPPIR